jgi:hypothetical protein
MTNDPLTIVTDVQKTSRKNRLKSMREEKCDFTRSPLQDKR